MPGPVPTQNTQQTERPGWPLQSSHSGVFIRLQKTISNRGFTLCFLTYSDSTYRDIVARFLRARLGAGQPVSAADERIGTETLLQRLAGDRATPAQIIDIELWPDGLDDILKRLNHRREALAERCPHPVLVWTRTQTTRQVATKAAGLWAWRSGVFDFTLPEDGDIRPLQHVDIRPYATRSNVASERIAELREYLAANRPWCSADVNLVIELGDFYRSLGESTKAEASYREAESASKDFDDPRRHAVIRGRIADILQDRGELDEALRIRRKEQLPVFDELGDARSYAIAQGGVADILAMRGELDEALRLRREEETPV